MTLRYCSQGFDGALSKHDAMKMDLVYCLNAWNQERWIAAPEVSITVPGSKKRRRFDVVALQTAARHAVIFEVKVSRQEALQWLQGETLSVAKSLRADLVLATPAGLMDNVEDWPRGVLLCEKNLTGRWDAFRFGASPGIPHAELMIGMVGALGTTMAYAGTLKEIGRSLVKNFAEPDDDDGEEWSAA